MNNRQEPTQEMPPDAILSIRDLSLSFPTYGGFSSVLHNVSFSVKKRDGAILDITDITSSKAREIRGADLSMIFQEPMTSLNPLFTIGNQLEEAILTHQSISQINIEKYFEEYQSPYYLCPNHYNLFSIQSLRKQLPCLRRRSAA